jgi:hypothetical protein
MSRLTIGHTFCTNNIVNYECASAFSAPLVGRFVSALAWYSMFHSVDYSLEEDKNGLECMDAFSYEYDALNWML